MMEVRFTIDVSLAEVLRKAGKGDLFGLDWGRPRETSDQLPPPTTGTRSQVKENIRR